MCPRLPPADCSFQPWYDVTVRPRSYSKIMVRQCTFRPGDNDKGLIKFSTFDGIWSRKATTKPPGPLVRSHIPERCSQGLRRMPRLSWFIMYVDTSIMEKTCSSCPQFSSKCSRFPALLQTPPPAVFIFSLPGWCLFSFSRDDFFGSAKHSVKLGSCHYSATAFRV